MMMKAMMKTFNDIYGLGAVLQLGLQLGLRLGLRLGLQLGLQLGLLSVIEPKYPYILNGYIHDTTSRSIRMAVKASFGFSTDDSRLRYVQIWWDRCAGSWVYGSSLITHDNNSHQYR